MFDRALIVRPLQDEDIPAVADLLNRFNFVPASEGYPISPEGLRRHLEECGTVLFLVAESQVHEKIVGTLCLCTLSEQRVAHPKEVFATMFLIHPEFRSGSIPNQMFTTALHTLVAGGYDCLSATVNPANVTALSLYKRIGLYRTRSCTIDYDGQLELRGHQPMIIRTMLGVNARLPQDSWLARAEHGWHFLVPPASLRTSHYDTSFWHELEVVTYDLQAEDWQLLFRIDVERDGLVEMRTDEVHFRLYPQQGAAVCVGDEAAVMVECTNLANVPRTYSVSIAQVAPELLPTRTFQPGESWRAVLPVDTTKAGSSLFRATLQQEYCAVEFATGMDVQEELEIQWVQPLQHLIAPRDWQVRMCLTNQRPEQIRGKLQINTPTLPGMQCSQAWIDLSGRESCEFVLSGTAAKTGTHAIAVQVYDEQGNVHVAEPLVLPVFEADQVVGYRRQQTVYLESSEMVAALSEKTGYLRIWDRRTTRLIVREPWPDVGPPLPGGLKRSKLRELTCLLQHEGTETTLACEERLPNGERLQRNMHFISPRLLAFSHRWYPNPSGEQLNRQMRTMGWCMLRKDMLTVPMREGWKTQCVIYGAYPFMRHDFETMPFSDLPVQPENYSANWSAFTEEELTVGMVWEHTDEIRYGGHWMPSLVFHLQAQHADMPVEIPCYAYYIGAGGPEAVANCWQQQYGRRSQDVYSSKVMDNPIDMPERQVPREEVQKLSEASFLRLVRDEADAGSEVRITPLRSREAQEGYQVDNGVLRWHVQPSFAGGLTSLSYQGNNLVQSAWPHPRPFGNHSIWYGGIHPYVAADRQDLLNSMLYDCTLDQPFQANECEEADALGNVWRGVKVYREKTCFTYMTLPGVPLLRLSMEAQNSDGTTHSYDLLFNAFFRRLQGAHVPKATWYERMGHLYTMHEEKRSRRVYASGWSVVAPGKNIFVALVGRPSSQLEVATYEWPQEGFQHAMIGSLRVLPGRSQQTCVYLWITHGLDQALAAARALSRGEIVNRANLASLAHDVS